MKNFYKNLRLAPILQSNKGYTLIEALFAILLFSLIFGICMTILLTGSDFWQVNSTLIEVQQEMRKAEDWMKEDLVEAGATTISNVPADNNPYDTITFKVASGVSGGNVTWSSNSIRYVLGGTNLDELQRIEGLETKTLAHNIESLSFLRLSTTPNILKVSVGAQKTTPKGPQVSATISFQVVIRN